MGAIYLGEGYCYKCNHCGYEEAFYTGVGFMFLKMQIAAREDILEGIFGKEIKSFLEAHPKC